MTPSTFYTLRPGHVVSRDTTRAVVIAGPVATRLGFRVELRVDGSRRYINPTTCKDWRLDA